MKINKKFVFQYSSRRRRRKKSKTVILFLNSLIFRPTHLRFFDICLLLVILTMATHIVIEREKIKRKRPSMLSSPQLSTLIFSFFFSLSLSLISCVFSCRIILRNQKKNRCTNTFCLLSFFFHDALANLKSTDAC